MTPSFPTGEVVSLLTAACFALSVVFFTRAGERIGSMNVNPIRLTIGFAFLCAYGVIARGVPLPMDASRDAWLWLSLSGVVGLFLGDLFLFRAFLDIGPRISALLMSLAPPLTALIGYLFLHERLGSRALLGMATTVLGIGMAILDRKETPREGRSATRGIAFGVLGAVGQAVGLVLSKRGMGSYNPFAATQIRILAALAAFVVLFVLLRRGATLRRALRDGTAMRSVAAGAFVGPFLGVGLSLLAVQYVETGIAASLIATAPIMVVPFAWAAGDRPGPLGLVGTIVAVLGVVLLVFH